MCLAIPGKIIELEGSEQISRMGKVSFGGAVKEVSMAYVPEAKVGDYVVVHVGFALSVLDEAEALLTLKDLDDIVKLASREKANS